MQVISLNDRGRQGGTGIPEPIEDMPGKSFCEQGVRVAVSATLADNFNGIYQGNGFLRITEDPY